MSSEGVPRAPVGSGAVIALPPVPERYTDVSCTPRLRGHPQRPAVLRLPPSVAPHTVLAARQLAAHRHPHMHVCHSVGYHSVGYLSLHVQAEAVRLTLLAALLRMLHVQ